MSGKMGEMDSDYMSATKQVKDYLNMWQEWVDNTATQTYHAFFFNFFWNSFLVLFMFNGKSTKDKSVKYKFVILL